MGTVTRLPAPETITLSQAITAYLAALGHPETAGRHRIYGYTYKALAEGLGGDSNVAALGTPIAARLNPSSTSARHKAG